MSIENLLGARATTLTLPQNQARGTRALPRIEFWGKSLWGQKLSAILTISDKPRNIGAVRVLPVSDYLHFEDELRLKKLQFLSRVVSAGDVSRFKPPNWQINSLTLRSF